MRGEIFYLWKAVNLLDTELGSVRSSLLLSHRDALNSQLKVVSTYKFFGNFPLERISAGYGSTGYNVFQSALSLGICFKSPIMSISFM
jgi:hypothetical protein